MRLLVWLVLLVWTIDVVSASLPVARHVVVEAEPETDYVIQLLPWDSDDLPTASFPFTCKISSLPSSGTLYHLTQVYSVFGYDPKRSTAISSTPATIAALATNRVLFAAPLGFTRTQFSYSVTNVNGTSVRDGIVYITAADRVVQNSDFIESAEAWQVSAMSDITATWSATSTGSLNHFVYADNIPLVVGQKNADVRWSFKSPAKFHANYARAYNGFLQFWLTSFAGDFNANVYSNPKTFVSITCSVCNGGAGITLAQRNISYTGDTRFFNFTLNEAMINEWKKDPKDITITEWSSPTACEFSDVLGNISSIAIVPDVTSEYEAVALDEVKIVLGASDVSTSCYGNAL